MAWYDEAVFYHIYPLGLVGAPKNNDFNREEIVHRLRDIYPWIGHIKKIGCNAIYIGPLFESEGHGYETRDYKRLDARLGDNEDLREFVEKCHEENIRVILDGVFNHTGRSFFAFQDIKKNRENSQYKDWYCNVNFYGNNEYDDGFSYDNWGGYNLLAKLNQRNPAVKEYIADVIRFWVREFDIDGIRLDAADVLDFEFMHMLRAVANEVKADFYLMGEVIHGEYNRWVNEGTLHAVTNYHLHKALYSGMNDHNFFEIAHTVKRLYGMGGNRTGGIRLYNFVDNHDVERIYTKLNNKAHFVPVHIMLYTLPGVPSIYYGSEFAIEGRKERNSDDSLRPAIRLEDYKSAYTDKPCTRLIASLGDIRKNYKALSYGDYREVILTNRQYVYSRNLGNEHIYIVLNNDDNACELSIPVEGDGEFTGILTGKVYKACEGRINVNVPASLGDIIVIKEGNGIENKTAVAAPIEAAIQNDGSDTKTADDISEQSTQNEVYRVINKPYEDMTIEELQEAILEKMSKNGPITQDMLRSVRENVYPDSLLNWVRSFR
ncbi:MAG: alpha-amylase family glycosyl hydrolase [Lachnospiraceae bacterium]|nr:alpha-amylase family glycosyl hydrolase [Lachnospiraceae bacterium]